MKSSTYARIAAWNVIADQELPAGTKVIVKEGQVVIRLRDSQSARTPYGPADTPDSLYSALADAVQAITQTPRR